MSFPKPDTKAGARTPAALEGNWSILTPPLLSLPAHPAGATFSHEGALLPSPKIPVSRPVGGRLTLAQFACTAGRRPWSQRQATQISAHSRCLGDSKEIVGSAIGNV